MTPILLALPAFAACNGDDSSPGDGASDASPDADAPADTADTAGEEDGCTHEYATVEASEQECYYESTGTSTLWMYFGNIEGASDDPPFSFLGIELWPDFGGPYLPGTYDFTQDDYASCSLCGLVSTGCAHEGEELMCEKELLAIAGSVELTQVGEIGETFEGGVSDMFAIEVTIDWETFESTPVPGGETLCIESMDFSAPVEAFPEE
ncbi:MAG: hypothetical protein ABIJ56_19915 [Pseudomonadota bacterium]